MKTGEDQVKAGKEGAGAGGESEYRPGDVFVDREGVVLSHGIPNSHYVLLTAQRIYPSTTWKWRAARFVCDVEGGFSGASLAVVWECELARLERVGMVPMAKAERDAPAGLPRQ